MVRKLGTPLYVDDRWRQGVKAKLKERKMSGAALGEKYGVHRATISKMLRLTNHPGHQKGNRLAADIAEFLGVPLPAAPGTKEHRDLKEESIDRGHELIDIIRDGDRVQHERMIGFLELVADSVMRKKRSR